MNESSLNKKAFSHSKKVQLMTSKNTFQMHTSPILLDILFSGLLQTAEERHNTMSWLFDLRDQTF